MSEQMSSLEREMRSGRPTMILTSGDSMEPLLYHKDTQVIVIRTDRELHPGDLPVYKRPGGQFVMHRVIRTDDENYYTRGDNRCGLERVPKEWVLAVAVEIYRKNRHIQVTDAGYRLYVWLWNVVYPLRWLWYRFRAKFSGKRK